MGDRLSSVTGAEGTLLFLRADFGCHILAKIMLSFFRLWQMVLQQKSHQMSLKKDITIQRWDDVSFS